jgi:hypothetical protein
VGGAGEGNRTLVFSLEVDELGSMFIGNSDILHALRMIETTTEFFVIRMAAAMHSFGIHAAKHKKTCLETVRSIVGRIPKPTA